jgi:hypothetical protein
MEDTTRLFYVVDGADTNEEIFETLEEAETFFGQFEASEEPRIYIAQVKNAIKEADGWNYEDLSDTFDMVKIIKNTNMMGDL